MTNETLHIIVPFFNFSNSKIRIQNLKRTLNSLKSFENIHVVIVNGVYQGQSLENEEFIKDDKFSYIRYDLPSVLWVKENLINLAIKSLPSNWEYLCWIDSDIIFLNPNWVEETIDHLKNYDIVQLYTTIAYLDDNGNFDFSIKLPYHYPVSTSFVHECLRKNTYAFSPTGLGWGTKKEFYKKIGKFFEFAIVGGGDFIFAIAATQYYELAKVNTLLKDSPSENYTDQLMFYYNLFKDCKTYYINGLICHQWHGSLEQRQYESRWEIVLKHKFDPFLHVSKTSEGVIYFNDNAKNLEENILEYFNRRKD